MKDPRINPADQRNQALIYALKINDIHVIKTLIKDKRVDPSIENNDLIIEALYKKDFKLIE